MRLPWLRRETRADSSYTDALIEAITSKAGGTTTTLPTGTAALEAAAGFVARAFAAAEVEADDMATRVLDPSTLALIGRSLIRRGELVLLIRVEDGQLRLLPTASHDVDGGPDPASWQYRCTVSGPERTLTFNRVPAAGVVHLAYGRDPETPWKGVGPLQAARLAGRLSAETAAALADEASGPRGSVLPLPVGGQDPTVTKLRADLKKLRGALATVESVNTMAAGAAAPSNDWMQKRIGADPPAAMVELLDKASLEVYSACGVPAALFTEGDGTARREAYRIALHSSIAPLGRIVETELAAKLETAVSLSWAELRAGDISGRARAFQSMVGAGMDVAKAASLAGLIVADE